VTTGYDMMCAEADIAHEASLRARIELLEQENYRLKADLAESHTNELVRFGELQVMAETVSAWQGTAQSWKREANRLRLRLLIARANIVLDKLYRWPCWLKPTRANVGSEPYRKRVDRFESRTDRVTRILSGARAKLEARSNG
jgi:hypothetical protein